MNTELERLVEIQQEMEELIKESERLIRKNFKDEYNRASGYWIGHINSALGVEGSAMSMCSMLDTITSIKESLNDDDEEEADIIEYKEDIFPFR